MFVKTEDWDRQTTEKAEKGKTDIGHAICIRHLEIESGIDGSSNILHKCHTYKKERINQTIKIRRLKAKESNKNKKVNSRISLKGENKGKVYVYNDERT